MKHKVWLNLIVLWAILLAVGAVNTGQGTARAADCPPLFRKLTLEVNPPDSGTTEPPPGEHCLFPIVSPDEEEHTLGVPLVRNWKFVGWTGPDADDCADGKVRMLRDTSCTANFEERVGIFYSVFPPGGGRVEVSPPGGYYGYPTTADYTWYDRGTWVDVSAVPAGPGWELDFWTGRDADKCAAGRVQMNDHVVCDAVFLDRYSGAPASNSWMADIAVPARSRASRAWARR